MLAVAGDADYGSDGTLTMTLTYTRYFRFGIPDFLTEPWHADWATLVHSIDRVLYGVLLQRGISLWTNATAYVVGDLVFDSNDRFVYECLVAHTSAVSPTTFAEDRADNPSYWDAFTFASAEEAVDIITGDSVVIADQRYIVFNKLVAAASTVTLPGVGTRSGASLIIVDWAKNAGDIAISAAAGESIMGSATYILGSGEQVKLTPVEDLNGWVVEVG